MSRKRRLQDARVAKDKRAKRLAIGGGVVLALLLAWEVPHYLGGHKSAAPATTTTSTTTVPGSTTPTTTVPTTSATSVPPTTDTRLTNSDVPPRASSSQLFSFDHFASKDPFVQQAVVPPASSTTGTPTGSTSSNASTGSPPTGGGNYTASSARTLARTGAVTITVNGKTQTVRVGQSFPSSNPLFRLVSAAHGVARIGIANGSYSSGARTIALTVGHTMTLVDTADGVRYVLRLIAS